MKRLMSGKGDVWLVYDGECPVCAAYCNYIRVRQAVGRLHLVDARQSSEIMEEITRAGFDIDQGMVVKFNNVLYYGADAIHVLTCLSTRSGVLNHLNYLFFSTRIVARLFYPAGKVVRNLTLKVLGIQPIDNLGIYKPMPPVRRQKKSNDGLT